MSQGNGPGTVGTSVNGSQATAVDIDHGQVVAGEDPRVQVIVPDTSGKTADVLAKSFEADRMARAMALDLPERATRGEGEAEETVVEEPAAGDAAEVAAAGTPPAPAPKAAKEPKAAGAPEDPERQARIERAASDAKRASAAARLRREQFATEQQRAARAEQQRDAMARELAELRPIRDGIRRDPLDAVRQTTGLTIQQLTEMALKEGTPEARLEALAKVSEEATKRVAALETSIKQREADAARTANEARNEEAFIKAAGAKVKLAGATEATPRYPELAGIDRPTLVAMAIGVARQTMARYQKAGLPYVQPTDRQILEHLNDSLGKRTKGSPATEPKKSAPTAASTKAATATGTRKVSPAPRTVTNGMSTGVLKSTPELSSLPREKRIAEMVRRGML